MEQKFDKFGAFFGKRMTTGPDAIGSPLDTHFGAQMEPIGLQLGMGKAATWKQK